MGLAREVTAIHKMLFEREFSAFIRKVISKKYTKIAVVGDRRLVDTPFIEFYLRKLANKIEDLVLVSGGARGVDSLVKNFAKKHSVSYKEYPADWKRHGRAAGPIRNTSIVREAEAMLAFVSKDSVGTRNSIRQAQKKGMLLHVIDVTDIINSQGENYEKLSEGISYDKDTNTMHIDLSSSGDIKLSFKKPRIGEPLVAGKFSVYRKTARLRADLQIVSPFLRYSSKADSKLLRILKGDTSVNIDPPHGIDLFIKKGAALINSYIKKTSKPDLIVIPESGSDLNFRYANALSIKLGGVPIKKINKNQLGKIKVKLGFLKEEPDIRKKLMNNVNKHGRLKISKLPPAIKLKITNVFDDSQLKVEGLSVLIVDDFTTSEATISLIADQLFLAGAKNVLGTVLIRSK